MIAAFALGLVHVLGEVHQHQRADVVVEAVAVLPARGGALRVLVEPAGVGEPAQVREHRRRHVEVAAHETRARPLATSPAATAR